MSSSKSLVVLSLVFFLAGPVWAIDYLAGSKAERAGLEMVQDRAAGVRLREHSVQLLQADDQSFAGHFLLGNALHSSQGDLPRARFHLTRAVELYQARWKGQLGPWGWYRLSLRELARVNAQMDLHAEQLQVLEHYSGLLSRVRALGLVDPAHEDPARVLVDSAWPLMKLGREGEAREALRQGRQLGTPDTLKAYWNTLGAVEMESGHPAASYAAFQELASQEQSVTNFSNLGEASAALARLDEAQAHLRTAAGLFDASADANPWVALSEIALCAGFYEDAATALEESHLWRSRQESLIAQRAWSKGQHASAEVLFHLGESRTAMDLLTPVVNRPDRLAGDSLQPHQHQGGTLVLYRALLISEARVAQERLSWLEGGEWWSTALQRARLLTAAERVELELRGMATRNKALSATLRPQHAPGALRLATWHRPDLVAIYGPGLASSALAEARSEGLEHEQPVLEALRAEVAWMVGEAEEAEGILRSVLPRLGNDQVLLRARVQGRLATLLLEQSRVQESLPYLERLLRTAPALVRHLDISLPVRVETDGTAPTQALAAGLLKSPRFQPHEDGCLLQLRTVKADLRIRLLTPDGRLLSGVSLAAQQPVGQLLHHFHADAFDPAGSWRVDSLTGARLGNSRRSQRYRQALGG